MKATPNRYLHDIVRSTVRWVVRCVHLGNIDMKSEDSMLLKESVAYSQCMSKEKVDMCLINDALYQEDRMHLVNNVCLIARGT